jgi:hypothetical protein
MTRVLGGPFTCAAAKLPNTRNNNANRIMLEVPPEKFDIDIEIVAQSGRQ